MERMDENELAAAWEKTIRAHNENMTDEEVAARVAEAVERSREHWEKSPILSKMQELKREDLLRVINGSYIAERFFNRSRSWFSQKLNNSMMNGKTMAFTKEELKTLSNALYTIAFELESLADDLEYEAR